MRIAARRMWLYLMLAFGGWVLASQVWLPWVLRRAQAGRAPEWLRRLVPRAVDDPVGFAQRWAAYSWTLTALMLLIVLVLLLSTQPALRSWVESRHGKATGLDPSRALGRWRGPMVQAVILGILTASMLSSVTGVEVWPFSPYRMYSSIQTRSFSLLRLTGTTDTGTLDLSVVETALPFDRTRFHNAMRRLLEARHGCDWFPRVARYALTKYGTVRSVGSAPASAIRTVRLSEFTWDLESRLPTPMAGSEKLICEWRPDPRKRFR